MIDLSHPENQIKCVTNFHDLVNAPFHEKMNAICWTRNLVGDFVEIVNLVELHGNMVELGEEELHELQLSEQGQLAREVLVNDLKLLKAYGASPVLNVIKCYDRDNSFTVFPTDVYSYHVDRSPVPTDTFLCTYLGESSEIIPNLQAEQKVLIPEIRNELKTLHGGADEDFETFLSENFFDLHYQPKPKSSPISLGLGNVWRIAVDYPENKVLPCLHRAPAEKPGQKRLLLIC